MQLPSPGYLFGMIIFSLFGLWAFKEGKREVNVKELLLGIALMGYTYFTPETWMVYAGGVVLTWAVFACRD